MKKRFFYNALIFVLFLTPSFALAEQININSATLSQLDEIAHIGTKTAQKIIDSRPYSSIQDLSRVKGIGDGKYLQDIINQGWACVNCTTEISQTQNTDIVNQNLTSITSPATVAPTVPQITYPSDMYINEILPAPEGADEQNEWLEIYNGNDFEVDLAGWQIKDQIGAIKTYAWPANSFIKARGFLTVSRAQSKIVLQNNGDGLTLINPQGTMADQITYPASPANQSYNRVSSGWTWSRVLTPGQPNEIDKVSAAVQQKIAQKKSATTSAATAISSNSLATLPLTAQVNQFSPSNNKLSRIFTFLLAIAVAATSAIVVMFLRKRDGYKTIP